MGYKGRDLRLCRMYLAAQKIIMINLALTVDMGSASAAFCRCSFTRRELAQICRCAEV